MPRWCRTNFGNECGEWFRNCFLNIKVFKLEAVRKLYVGGVALGQQD